MIVLRNYLIRDCTYGISIHNSRIERLWNEHNNNVMEFIFLDTDNNSDDLILHYARMRSVRYRIE